MSVLTEGKMRQFRQNKNPSRPKPLTYSHGRGQKNISEELLNIYNNVLNGLPFDLFSEDISNFINDSKIDILKLILLEQQEVLCSQIRFNGVSIENIKRIFNDVYTDSF